MNEKCLQWVRRYDKVEKHWGLRPTIRQEAGQRGQSRIRRDHDPRSHF